MLGIGTTFELSAVYSDTLHEASLAPGETFTITVSYTSTQLGAAIEDSLALYYWDGSQWAREPTSRLEGSQPSPHGSIGQALPVGCIG